ncbi:sugar phosphate isomerase/epimerase family protein [Paludisphaera mucosa]|uniref:Sugar phosphate isomerase/epimerase n=1 Tax=Paludisphaera mucosa TaxID=3030827 RepID=A0ABT6FG53_9BACT|nr:sugar phosphate isomerase/epimerase [Paludisphaera mucosa]MDG3006512.1 sugar phosphate isomerase/epimerase [Paludisphaera mucosa]
MTTRRDANLSRRGLLGGGLAALGALAVGRPLRAGGIGAAFAKAPFRLGLQSYSLRGYKVDGKSSLEKALAVSNALEIRNWEVYPGHIPITADADVIRKTQDELKKAQVDVVGYGVIPFKKGDPNNRKPFEFAKAMGIEYLSADPDPDSFDELDKLVEEFGIGVGIHNHGPGHRYDLIDVIAKAIKDHSPKIGCCIDAGHFLRSKEDPVRAAEVFGKRVFGVHLKDVKDATTFTILGKGDLNYPGLFKVLAANDYTGLVALEYEENEENPADDIRVCLEEALKALEPN